VISYALEPVVARVERVRIPRLLGAGLLSLLVMGGVARGVYALRDELKEATQAVPEATCRAGAWLGIERSARQTEEAIRSPAWFSNVSAGCCRRPAT
jgi:predicted PurR-regulated permease PerM